MVYNDPFSDAAFKPKPRPKKKAKKKRVEKAEKRPPRAPRPAPAPRQRKARAAPATPRGGRGMVFYLGAPKQFLWGTESNPAPKVPLFVSRSEFKNRNTGLISLRSRPGKAKSVWALDSGGFKELEKHGKWTVTPEQYVKEVRFLAERVGKLQWASIQDYMCEPPILFGGPTDPGSRAVGTFLSVEEHQLRTVENFCRLRELGGREMAHLWAPVLQGWCLEDYVEHLHLYTTLAHVDLSEVPVIGIGSICRRQGTEMVSALIRLLGDGYGLTGRLHAFGAKRTGLPMRSTVAGGADPEISYEEWAEAVLSEHDWWTPGLVTQATLYATESGPSTWEEAPAKVCHFLQSADSYAWSSEARHYANAVRAARDLEWGGPGRDRRDPVGWAQKGDEIWAGGRWVYRKGAGGKKVKDRYVGGRAVGKVKHELAGYGRRIEGRGKPSPFAPTQMTPECSRSFARISGASHESCSSCVRWAMAWRSMLMSVLPRDCRGTIPPPPPEVTHKKPVCGAAERVAIKLAEIRRYELELMTGAARPSKRRWERLKAMPGAKGPLLPVKALQAVYPRMKRGKRRPMPDMTCRAWGTGEFRWGEGGRPAIVPHVPSPWQPRWHRNPIPEAGDRIELIEMPDDPYPYPPGSKGTVEWVQLVNLGGGMLGGTATGGFFQVGVKWDHGGGLMLSIPPDRIRILGASE